MGMDHNRKPAQTGTTILIALFVFIACAFASAVIAAYHRDKIEKVVAFLQSLNKPAPAISLPPPGSVKRDRVAIQPILSDRLTKPEIVYRNAAFTMADAFAAIDFCALLQPAFADLKLQWRSNALFGDTSDCAGELNVSLAPNEAAHNSFFIQIRRSVTGRSTGVRLKLVSVPEKQEPKYDAEFERAAELVVSRIFSTDAQTIMANIRAFKPFSLEIRGIKVKFFEEQMTPGAFNLMLEANCGKYDCQATNSYYKLNLPPIELPPKDLGADGGVQQE